MNNQDHRHLWQPDDEALAKMCEASLQLIVKSDTTKQRLQEHEPGMRSQPLIFESYFRKPMDGA